MCHDWPVKKPIVYFLIRMKRNLKCTLLHPLGSQNKDFSAASQTLLTEVKFPLCDTAKYNKASMFLIRGVPLSRQHPGLQLTGMEKILQIYFSFASNRFSTTSQCRPWTALSSSSISFCSLRHLDFVMDLEYQD